MGRSEVEPSADVFALGCVLYECLTGRAPFESPHPVAVLAKVLREEPQSASELCTWLNANMDRLLCRALAKDPAARPANAAALAGELDALAAGQSIVADASVLARARLQREQKIASVVLGRPEAVAAATRADQMKTLEEQELRYLTHHFSADVSPLQGGAILLLFPGRGEANDRAFQAVRCALALKQLRPELRLAVATGLAETSGFVPVGAAIDRAASLLEGDPRGSARERNDVAIFIDDLTMGLIGPRCEVRRVGERNLLSAIRADLDAPRKLMGRETPCVGRDLELRLLDSALEECVASGSSRAVLVTGPPGIGKSRLASEWLRRQGQLEGVQLLIARADPMTSGATFSLVQRLLRCAAGLEEAEPLAKQRARLYEHVRALHDGVALPASEPARSREPRAAEGTPPTDRRDESSRIGNSHLEGEGAPPRVADFLAELLGLPDPAPPDPLLRAARNSPEIMREQTRRALEAWMDAELARRAVTVVVEDLHWGDGPSVDFLAQMLRRATRWPLLVLVLSRPEGEERFPQLSQRASLQIRLPGLGPRVAERLVRDALEPAPDDQVVAEMVRTADGNAFYLEELIRHVAAGSSQLPETVLAMAQSRLEQLAPEARYVLRAASVFGDTCWADGVARMVDPSIDTGKLLEALADQEILVRAHASRYVKTREYRFRHALLRDAAYAMLTPRDREDAHRTAGEWLEGVGEKEARLLAEHFMAGNARLQALPWVVRAARSAIDNGDLKSTFELADRGIALGATGLDRGLLLLARAHAGAWSGATDLGDLQETLDLLPHGSAPWWLAVALLTLAESAAGRPERAETYVGLALAAPASSDHAGPFGQALLILVGALVLLGRGELSGTLIERARAAPDDARADPIFDAFVTAARCALASVAPIGGRWQLEYALRAGWECAQKMRATGALCGEAMVLNYCAVGATHLGRYQEAQDACERALSLARHAGSGLTVDWAQVFLAKAQVRLGKPEQALSTLALLYDSPNKNLLQILAATAAEARLQQGRFDEAIAEAEIAVAGVSPRLRRMAGCIRARAQLAVGQPALALAAIEAAFREQTSTGLDSEIELFTAHAEALEALGDLEGARAAVRKARDFVLHTAASIADEGLRRGFVEGIEACARATELAARLLDGR